MSKRRDRSAELDELRKAFANMAMFDVRPSARNKQHWDIFTRGGLWVGTINRAGGSLLMRTLGVLTDQARTRTLHQLPYPSKAQSQRGVKRPARTPRTRTPAPPVMPAPAPRTPPTPASVAVSRPAQPDE